MIADEDDSGSVRNGGETVMGVGTARPVRRRWVRWSSRLIVAAGLLTLGYWLVTAVDRARTAAHASTTL
jgi:hypothetical protein